MIYTPENYEFKKTKPIYEQQPTINEYLNETNLGVFLKWLFSSSEIIRDRKFPHIKQTIRPDYIIEDYKLIVEFDGPYHYTNSQKYKTDKEQTELYNTHGYNVIRIPYFIQLNDRVIRLLFGKYLDDTTINTITSFNIYPHGFIDTKILPADFCSNGIKRFNSDLGFLSIHDWGEHVCTGVTNSIINKVNELKSMVKVIPDYTDTPYIKLLLDYIKESNVNLYNSEIKYFENCVPQTKHNNVTAFKYLTHLLFKYELGDIKTNLGSINEGDIENALVYNNIIDDNFDIVVNNNYIVSNEKFNLQDNSYSILELIHNYNYNNELSEEEFMGCFGSKSFGKDNLGQLLDILIFFES